MTAQNFNSKYPRHIIEDEYETLSPEVRKMITEQAGLSRRYYDVFSTPRRTLKVLPSLNFIDPKPKWYNRIKSRWTKWQTSRKQKLQQERLQR